MVFLIASICVLLSLMSLAAGSLVAMEMGNKKHNVVKSTQERVMLFQPLGNDVLLFSHRDLWSSYVLFFSTSLSLKL